ncbi:MULTISPECIES: ABC transporter ATP-binding protein [Clostridium]|uniref:ABC transporter ATP-binding protein n=1 Tax=Clostridium TaxID=1485 RepID=UPI00189A7A76|nr:MULTISPECIES: ABC transporter ATP-binding protein [Clostridium]MDI9217644.1 ABC transporter ATP-binding protein [Clostridium tertium]
MLEIKDLFKIYNNSKGLKGISFKLNNGEILGLVGNNGAGKSTLMKALMTFLKVDSGEILLDGVNVFKNREILLDKSAAVIENMGFYKELTGYEHLKMIKSIRGISDEDFNEILEFVDIGKAFKRRTSTYSLGMKQRLAVAIALLSAKEILVLDEPTNGLDQKSIIRLIKLLKKYKEKGYSILISSHTLADLEELCDRFIFLDNGNIINELNRDEINIDTYNFNIRESLNESHLKLFEGNYDEENNLIVSTEETLSNTINKLITNNIKINSVERTNNNLKKIYLDYFEGDK